MSLPALNPFGKSNRSTPAPSTDFICCTAYGGGDKSGRDWSNARPHAEYEQQFQTILDSANGKRIFIDTSSSVIGNFEIKPSHNCKVYGGFPVNGGGCYDPADREPQKTTLFRQNRAKPTTLNGTPASVIYCAYNEIESGTVLFDGIALSDGKGCCFRTAGIPEGYLVHLLNTITYPDSTPVTRVTFENCVVENNNFTIDTSMTYGAIYGGLWKNCIFRNNTLNTELIYANLNSCEIYGNTSNGTMISARSCTNSRIYGNISQATTAWVKLYLVIESENNRIYGNLYGPRSGNPDIMHVLCELRNSKNDLIYNNTRQNSCYNYLGLLYYSNNNIWHLGVYNNNIGDVSGSYKSMIITSTNTTGTNSFTRNCAFIGNTYTPSNKFYNVGANCAFGPVWSAHFYHTIYTATPTRAWGYEYVKTIEACDINTESCASHMTGVPSFIGRPSSNTLVDMQRNTTTNAQWKELHNATFIPKTTSIMLKSGVPRYADCTSDINGQARAVPTARGPVRSPTEAPWTPPPPLPPPQPID